jgi:hypothetical protein
MNRLTTAAIVLLSGIVLTACDESTATTSTAATFTVVPATATAVESTGVTYLIVGDATHDDRTVTYPWKTSFTVTITETAGVGRNVAGITCTVQQATGGIVITPTGGDKEYYKCDPHASGNRIEPKGSVSVSFDVWYDLPNKGREALVTATFSFLDDNSQSFSEATSVKVL